MEETDHLTGQRFTRLLAGVIAKRTKHGRFYLCQCDCGESAVVSSHQLLSGKTRSCGCLRREITGNRARIHGKTNTAEFRAWRAMKQRCLDPKMINFKRYGGKGITVCDRWLHSFENFFADMGPKPAPEYSLGRTDHKRGYEPENCRWMTLLEQMRTRTNGRLTWEKAVQIRKMYRAGQKIATIAREMDIEWGLANQVIKKKIWLKAH
jgi:ribosomal protein S27E